MSSCDTQRATSVSGRLVAFIAALMIALTTLFATTAVPQPAIAADDGQTNFDSWTAAAKNIEDQLATAEKTTMTAITVRLAPISRPRIGSVTTHPTSRKSSTTPSVPTSRRNCCSNSPILKVLPTSRTKATPSQPKIDALTAEINATAQTLDANADLANPKEYAKQRAAQTAEERKKLDAAKKNSSKGKGDRTWSEVASEMTVILDQAYEAAAPARATKVPRWSTTPTTSTTRSSASKRT